MPLGAWGARLMGKVKQIAERGDSQIKATVLQMRGLSHKAIPVFKFEPAARSLPRANVRFGSKADIGACVADVRFTPKSGHP